MIRFFAVILIICVVLLVITAFVFWDDIQRIADFLQARGNIEVRTDDNNEAD